MYYPCTFCIIIYISYALVVVDVKDQVSNLLRTINVFIIFLFSLEDEQYLIMFDSFFSNDMRNFRSLFR